jgi:hypothetical protein
MPEPAKIIPDECSHCGHAINLSEAVAEAIEKAVGEREAAAEAKYDALEERRRDNEKTSTH